MAIEAVLDCTRVAGPPQPRCWQARLRKQHIAGLSRPHHKLRGALAQVRPCESGLPPLTTAADAEAHAFSSFANWVIPGHLMVGRYPFVDPNRYRKREDGEKVLKQVLEAGITRIVSLQGELPPQEQMRMGGSHGFLPYHTTATLMAAAISDLPASEEITGLRNEHLNQFLPPRRAKSSKAEGEDLTKSGSRRIRLHFTHVPVTDLGIPKLMQVQQLVDDVRDWLKAGEKAYLHCWGGRGRAGTMAACILVDLYGLSGQEALDHVQLAYDTRGEGRLSPETNEQHRFVLDYAAGNLS